MKKKNQFFTIPNLLSLVRLAMIPLLLWLYLEKREYLWTAVVVVLSGATDIVDGIIARKYDLISDLGKALDPVADKLTQIAGGTGKVSAVNCIDEAKRRSWRNPSVRI